MPELPDAGSGGGRRVGRKAWVVALLLLPLFLFLSACPRTYGWHQRLTMSLDTPDGPVVASVVQRVDVTWFPEWMRVDRTARLTDLTGEALAFDLGGGRILLSILDDGLMTERLFSDQGRRPDVFAEIERRVGQPGRRIPPELVPRFVFLADVSDPAMAVDLPAKDFPAVLGAGYGLDEMTLAITDDPVSFGMVEQLLGADFLANLDRMMNERIADVVPGRADPGSLETLGRWTFMRRRE